MSTESLEEPVTDSSCAYGSASKPGSSALQKIAEATITLVVMAITVIFFVSAGLEIFGR